MSSEMMANGSSSPCSKAQASKSNNNFCSVCLDPVPGSGEDGRAERSIAKLKCGHNFHLDCIGSAFNAKGRMQCPNCRQVEQGQWLYANGCCLHEDFTDEFTFEEEVEAYSGAVNLQQFTPTPWCPHQGSYAHVSLTLEELDNFRIGYLDPLVSVRQGSRVSPAGHICPYLAAQGLSMGRSSSHFEDAFALHHHRPGRNTRRTAVPNSVPPNSTHQQAPATSSSSTMASYEGLQSFSGTRQHVLGFVVGSPQPLHAGVSQGSNIGNSIPRHAFGQPVHIHNVQGVHRNSHAQSMNTSRNGNGYVGRRPRQNEVPMIVERAQQVPAAAGAWSTTENTNEYGSFGAPSSLNHNSNPLSGGVWTGTPDGQVDPWATGMYVSPPSIPASSNWWSWVPPGNNHFQGLTPNAAPSTYHQDGQFFSAGMFPGAAAPITSFSEQPSENPYTWVFSGFQ